LIAFLSRRPGSAGTPMRRSVYAFRRTAFIDPSCNGFLAWVVRVLFGLVCHTASMRLFTAER
jgi:hypothetical protein